MFLQRHMHVALSNHITAAQKGNVTYTEGNIEKKENLIKERKKM